MAVFAEGVQRKGFVLDILPKAQGLLDLRGVRESTVFLKHPTNATVEVVAVVGRSSEVSFRKDMTRKRGWEYL